VSVVWFGRSLVCLMYKCIYTPAPPQFDCIELFAGSTNSVEGNEGYSYEFKINSLLSKFLMLCLQEVELRCRNPKLLN